MFNQKYCSTNLTLTHFVLSAFSQNNMVTKIMKKKVVAGARSLADTFMNFSSFIAFTHPSGN